jgi:ferredoxin
MPFVITAPCVGTKDTACLDACPCDCIHPTKDEAGFAESEMLYIDPDTCIDCDLCARACPVNAIFHEDDVPAEWRHFIELNAAHYRK